MLIPIFEQSKDFLSIDNEATPQLSVLPCSICETESVATPESSNNIVNGEATETVGGKLSTTVTIAEAEALLPLLSITVRFMVFGPKSEQVKVVLSRTIVSISQLSKLPSSISAVVMFAIPFSSKNTLISFVTTVGLKLSKTVTIASAMKGLSFVSYALRLTMLGPKSEQVKDVLSKAIA